MSKEYIVLLYRCPGCVRGWLPYLKAEGEPTLKVRVFAENGPKAKNIAVTMVNNNFDKLDIISVCRDGFWSVEKHPDILEKLNGLEVKSEQ